VFAHRRRYQAQKNLRFVPVRLSTCPQSRWITRCTTGSESSIRHTISPHWSRDAKQRGPDSPLRLSRCRRSSPLRFVANLKHIKSRIHVPAWGRGGGLTARCQEQRWPGARLRHWGDSNELGFPNRSARRQSVHIRLHSPFVFVRPLSTRLLLFGRSRFRGRGTLAGSESRSDF
jgi:hypothetical protein